MFFFVGAAGFEPATSWSQTRRDDRTTLRPDEGHLVTRITLFFVGANIECFFELSKHFVNNFFLINFTQLITISLHQKQMKKNRFFFL